MSYYQSIVDRIPISIFKSTNQIILQTLLVALVAKKYVLLRYADADKGLLSSLKSCRTILHVLFGLSVAEVDLNEAVNLSTEDFLRLLFFEQSDSGLRVPFANNFAPQEHEIHENSQGLTEAVGFQRSKIFSDLRFSSTSTSDRHISHQEAASLPQVLLISGLEAASPLIQRVLLNVFLDDHVTMNGRRWKLHDDFLAVYLCPNDAFERPNIQNSLLDRFAISSLVVDVETLKDSIDTSSFSKNEATSTIEEIPILTSIELSALRDLASSSYTQLHHNLTVYIADLFTLTRHHPHLDASLLGVQAHNDAVDVSRTWRVLFGPQGPANDDDNGQESSISQHDYMLDVTVDDIHAVFLRVVPHRLRVWNGPNDEVLASAIIRMSDVRRNLEWRTGRRPVTEILRQIIMDHL